MNRSYEKTQRTRRDGTWFGLVVGMAFVGTSVMLAACAGTPQAQQPVMAAVSSGGARIGVVDPQKLMSDTDPGKKARESLNSFMKNRQAVVELEEKELKRMEDDLIKQGSVLSAAAKKEREEAFRRRMMEYQQKIQEMNREVQERQKEVFEGFRDKVERVVGKVAQQMGLQMVFEKGRGGAVVYSEAALDITSRVVDELNHLGGDAAPIKK